MKKRTNSLTIQKNILRTEGIAAKQLTALFPGILLLAGFWGMLMDALELPLFLLMLLLPAVAVLCAVLMLDWNRKWHVVGIIGALLAAVALCSLFGSGLVPGIAGLLDRAGDWWLLRTGVYSPDFEGAGDETILLCLLFLLSGFVTALLLRMRTPVVHILLAVVILFVRVAGVIDGGWWLALYMLGVLLTVAVYASGLGKGVSSAAVIAVVLFAVIGGGILLIGTMPEKTEMGERIERMWHQLRWEPTENPLPEGVLTDLDVYAPGEEAVLEVTMEEWTPLYLRGFSAGCYTDSGWKQLDAVQLAAYADDLYALQDEYFLPVNQLSAAADVAGEKAENTVTVHSIGACRAYTYLPYGVGLVSSDVLSSTDLLHEGTYAPKELQYSAPLYDLESSYLLQAKIKNEINAPYRQAESVYRDWVYENYLTVPESDYETLMSYFTIEGTVTTVQAKRELTRLLAELIEYDERVLTHFGEKGFLPYVLEVSRSGYCVHYATLSTLLLRCCGIPARYVEGYVISPQQAERLDSGETFTVTQANAHAWTEYYLDGVGWIPFDATPGYTDFITYELPNEGLATQESGSGIQMENQDEPDPPKKDPKVEREKEKESRRIFIREAFNILLLLAIITVLALVARTVILRRKLRKKLSGFRSEDTRKGCAGALCYLLELTGAIANPGENPTVSELAGNAVESVDGQASASELAAMLNEVWYSTHPIPASSVEQTMAWICTARETWKRKVSLPRRFIQRFFTCKIL